MQQRRAKSDPHWTRAHRVFTDEEANYLTSQRLGRVATASPDGQPHAVPVTYEFDGEYIYFSGYKLTGSLKYQNILRNNKVAFVVDSLESVDPWAPKGIEIRGIASTIQKDGYQYVRITPFKKRGWGINRPIIMPAEIQEDVKR
jgi:pyridoxamine 5'-phosphate oxidase family protein